MGEEEEERRTESMGEGGKEQRRGRRADKGEAAAAVDSRKGASTMFWRGGVVVSWEKNTTPSQRHPSVEEGEESVAFVTTARQTGHIRTDHEDACLKCSRSRA